MFDFHWTGEDHNATSYSTETVENSLFAKMRQQAKIITLRAIALKPMHVRVLNALLEGEDHNATSYSTETFRYPALAFHLFGEDHNATSYSTETCAKVKADQLHAGEDHNATSYSTETCRPYSHPACR